MKLTIERAELLKSLNHVHNVVERRTTMPILSNVLLEADGQALSLTATDLDLTIIERSEATIHEGGTTTAPAHTFYDIIRKLPDGAQIVIEASETEQQVEISAGRSNFSLSSLAKEDFPSLGSDDLPHKFLLPALVLRSIIDRTRFAISTEETRYYLNGIYLHPLTTADAEPCLRAVATDGHRLARVDMPLPAGAESMPGVILPKKTAETLRKLIDETQEEIEIALSDTKISFSFENILLTSKLIDGTFPDYERVIPVANDKVMEVDCKVFTQAVDRVSTIFSNEKARSIKLSLNGAQLVLSATSTDNSTATDELEITYESAPLEIGFNAKYLLDITQQIEGQGAEFIMADTNAPTIVRDSADDSALYVLMPMRV